MSKEQNPRNPKNSTLIQGLLEAERTGRFNTKILEAAIKELQTSPQGIREADTAVVSKPYNDSKVTFYQTPVFDQCNRQLLLSPSACKMLELLRAYMSQQNTIVIDRMLCCKILDLKDRQLRNVVAELRKAQILAVSKPQSGRNPPEYMINPRVGFRGKREYLGTMIRRFWQLRGIPEDEIALADHDFKKSAFPDLEIGTDHPKQRIGCGYIRVAAKKEPSDIPSPEGSAKKAPNNSNSTADFQLAQDPELDKLFPGE